MKLSNYILFFEDEDNLTIYNTSTDKAVIVKDDTMINQIKKFYYGDRIIENSFNENNYEFCRMMIDERNFVEKHLDEINLANFYYTQKLLSDDTLNLIIIPTRQCNFTCPYCYEEHEDKVMADDTYLSILNNIQKTMKYLKYKKLLINWFGGEPLLEIKNISNFMRKIKEVVEKDTIIVGQITSNGYLLSSENFESLLSVGVNLFQITVDGLERFHNETRILKSGVGTWERIIENLRSIKKEQDLNFHITIRSNFTNESIKYYKEWIDFLKENFGNDARFSFHFETVKNLGGENNKYIANNVDESIDNYLSKAINYSKSKGINLLVLDSMIGRNKFICYASNPNSLVFDYDGSIRKCTVSIDSDLNKVGYISDGNLFFDDNKFAYWVNNDIQESCKICPIFPACYGKKCPNVYKSDENCKMFIGLYKTVVQSKLKKDNLF